MSDDDTSEFKPGVDKTKKPRYVYHVEKKKKFLRGDLVASAAGRFIVWMVGDDYMLALPMNPKGHVLFGRPVQRLNPAQCVRIGIASLDQLARAKAAYAALPGIAASLQSARETNTTADELSQDAERVAPQGQRYYNGNQIADNCYWVQPKLRGGE